MEGMSNVLHARQNGLAVALLQTAAKFAYELVWMPPQQLCPQSLAFRLLILRIASLLSTR